MLCRGRFGAPALGSGTVSETFLGVTPGDHWAPGATQHPAQKRPTLGVHSAQGDSALTFQPDREPHKPHRREREEGT